jgi:crossover junction endodeoxyribonuclease RuvC
LKTPLNKERNVVLGIDPGLATTGWGIVEKKDSRLILHNFGVILTTAGLPLPHRLLHISKTLAGIVQTYRPTLIAIEELYFAKFAVSIAATAQARGAILLCAADAGLPVIEYNPRTVKMSMTGFGSASKIQIQSMVQRFFGLKEPPRPDDAADAMAIALCHLQTNQLLSAGRGTRNAEVGRPFLKEIPSSAFRTPRSALPS